MKNEAQSLFGGLWMLLSGLEFDNILCQFRASSDEAEAGIITIDSYTYDPVLDVRIVYKNDGDDVFYSVQQSFDDYFIDIIDRERSKILTGIQEIYYDCASSFEQTNKMKLFKAEIAVLEDDYRAYQWEPLTENAYKFIDNTIHEIKYQIDSLLHDIDNLHIRTTGKQIQLVEPPPPVLKSSWARRHTNEIRNIYKKLKPDFIPDRDGRVTTFVSIFCDGKVPKSADRIIWKNTNSLKYFLDELTKLTVPSSSSSGEQKMFTFPENQWIWASKCFVKEDGKEHKYISNINKAKVLSHIKRQKLDSIITSLTE